MLQSRVVIVALVLVAFLATLVYGQKSRFVDYEETFTSAEELDEEVLQDLLMQNIEDLEFPKLDLTNSEHVLALESLEADDEFVQFRETKYQLAFGMSAEEYDTAFLAARENILKLASLSGVSVDVATTSYDDALELIASSQTTLQSQSLQQLFSDSYLFEDVTTLEDPVVADANLYAPALAVRFIRWLIKNINSHKCQWCKAVVNSIRKKLCNLAGSAICKLAAKAFGALSFAISTWVCGAPLHVSRIFGHWCQVGVKWIQRKTKLTDRVICGFSIPTFSVMGQSVRIGKICH